MGRPACYNIPGFRSGGASVAADAGGLGHVCYLVWLRDNYGSARYVCGGRFSGCYRRAVRIVVVLVSGWRFLRTSALSADYHDLLRLFPYSVWAIGRIAVGLDGYSVVF